MKLQSWDDIRIALAVARTGTVSGAAAALGVHHATVIRRVDSLEQQLGTRLFLRHSRGYALTEAGRALLQTAGDADERFAQMAARISGAGDRVEGELTITSLPELADFLMPRVNDLLGRHPGLRLRYVTDTRLFRLETGEAHIAVRAGPRPTEPDYVVRSLGTTRQNLYAAPNYTPGFSEGLAGHRFVLPGPEVGAAPAMRWLTRHLPDVHVVMVSNDSVAREAVIRSGRAIGFLSPERGKGLAEVMALPEWESQLWLITHVDLHRTPKVRAALEVLRSA
ncbi:LysR family transcriptional regulator [Paracoccus sp. (in: a-proteobacteria)]|uniref:LysR family transcriptional regulator n=1 Tax=Paracoccus sp. TaxID=267 RepID=UPI003A8507A3